MPLIDPAPLPDAVAIQQEAVRLLRYATPRQRLCLEFYYLAEMTDREIGRALGVPYQNIHQARHRGLARIRANVKRRVKPCN